MSFEESKMRPGSEPPINEEAKMAMGEESKM